MTRYARITGTGSSLPPQRLTNADMVTMLAARGVETSDEWIVERTGIRRATSWPTVCTPAIWRPRPAGRPWTPQVPCRAIST